MSGPKGRFPVELQGASETAQHQGISIFEMALTFLKIGLIGFGGGMAVIALMERECIRRHGCLEAKEFLHGVALGQILGPFAVNAAIFIGFRMFGPLGSLVAAVSFLAPSVVLVVVLSWLYSAFHHIPSLQGALAGLGPVVIALILSAAWSMGQKELRSTAAMIIAAAACVAGLLHLNPVWLLLAAGLAGLGWKLGAREMPPPPTAQPPRGAFSLLPVMAAGREFSVSPSQLIPVSGSISGGAATVLAGSVGLAQLGSVFFKVGLVFFGGGFVLIPVLNHQLVQHLGWLTPQQFMDGVAISELTPGPIAVLATFAGFLKAGIPGALVATMALFAPAMLLMLLISSFYERLRRQRFAQDFLAGAEPAVIGLIVAAALALAPSSISLARPVSLGLGLLSLVLLVRFRWHPVFVLLLGALAGIAGPGLFH